MVEPGFGHLLDTLHLPWPAQRHPQAALHEQGARATAARYGLLAEDLAQPDARRFQGFVEIDSFVYPYPTLERLEAAGAFNQWLYFIDDQYDEHPELGHNVLAVRRLMERGLAVLSTGELPAEPTPFLRFTGYLRDLLVELAPEGWMPRFLADVTGYLFRGSMAAMEYWSRGAVPTVDEYVDLRMHDSALFPATDIIEVANDVHLPEAVRMHPLLHELRIRCTRHVAFVNDLFSYHKEVLRNGAPFNLVHVLQANESLPLEVAIRRATAICNEDMRRFLDAEEALPSFGGRADREVAKYLEGLKGWMRGNVDFSAQSARFRADTNPIERTGAA